MATRIDLPPLPPFDPVSDPSSLSQRWKTWTKCFQFATLYQVYEDAQCLQLLLFSTQCTMHKHHSVACVHTFKSLLELIMYTKCQFWSRVEDYGEHGARCTSPVYIIITELATILTASSGSSL